MSLTPEQRRIASLIVRIGLARHERPKRIIANLETGRVESNFGNPPGGSGSSKGYRQETAESYPNVNRRDVRAAINRFYDEARRVPTRGRTAGQIAQAVQRSAYPGRYQQHKGEAIRLYRGLAKGGPIGLGGGISGSITASVTPGQIQAGNTRVVDLLNPPKPVQPSGIPVPEPSFSAHNRLPVPAGYQAPPQVGAPVAPSSLSDQLRQIQQLAPTDVPRPTVSVTGKFSGSGGGSVPGGRGRVIGHPLDRSGVRTRPQTIRFVERVAGVYGHPIRLGTGTAHSRMTVNGNVSDHWSGHALDLPATGAKLIRMGQAALIAAGANPHWARRQHGGLYNVHGHQVIFNTHQGGDHTNHLHVSV